jgi:hypothetical protein
MLPLRKRVGGLTHICSLACRVLFLFRNLLVVSLVTQRSTSFRVLTPLDS